MRGSRIAWTFAGVIGGLITLVVGLMAMEEASMRRASSVGAPPPQHADRGAAPDTGSPAEQPQEAAAAQSAEIDFSYFKQGDILKAFYDGDQAYLATNERLVLMYIGPLNASLSQQALYAGDPMLVQLLDDSIGPAAERKMATSAHAHNQAITGAAEVLGGLLGTMEKYSNEGTANPGSIGEFTADVAGSLIPEGYMTVEQINGDATTDGRRLIALYQQSPAAFDRIYSSMLAYVSNR